MRTKNESLESYSTYTNGYGWLRNNIYKCGFNHYATTIRNGNRHVEKDQSKKFPHPVGCRMPMPVSVGALSLWLYRCYASAS